MIETSRCGDGFASTADRAILGLDYAPGCDSGLPSRLLLKTMLLRSHIPDSMYKNEVRFYRDIRHELAIEAPRAFASVFDEETGQFGVIMEDLTLRSARFPNATTPVALEEVTGLVHTLAALHAHYWASSRFQRDLSWLPTPRSGGMYEIFKSMGLELVRDQVEKNDFKAELIRPLNRSVDQLWEALWKVQDILDSEPSTLLHGDPHIGNTYLLGDGNGGLLDWQLMVKGRWAHDLTYLLVTALDPDDRRKHERDLIATYLDELRRRGVERPPERERGLEALPPGRRLGPRDRVAHHAPAELRPGHHRRQPLAPRQRRPRSRDISSNSLKGAVFHTQISAGERPSGSASRRWESSPRW